MQVNGQSPQSESQDNPDSVASSQPLDRFRQRRISKQGMKAIPPPPPPLRVKPPAMPTHRAGEPTSADKSTPSAVASKVEQSHKPQESAPSATASKVEQSHKPQESAPSATASKVEPSRKQPSKDRTQVSGSRRASSRKAKAAAEKKAMAQKKATDKALSRKPQPSQSVSGDSVVAEKRHSKPAKSSGKGLFHAILYGTLPVILLGAAAFVATNRMATDRIAKVQQIEATQISDTLNRFMVERVQDIQSVAALSELEQLLVPPTGDRATVLQQQQQQQLERLRLSLGQYDGLALFDLQGRPLLQTLGVVMDGEGNTDFFQAVVEANASQVSHPQIGQDSGQGVVYIASPVRNRRGNTVAVIMARLPLGELADAVESKSIEGQYTLADSQGQIFLSKDIEAVGQPIQTVFAPFVASLNGNTSGRYVSSQLKNGWLLLKQLGQGDVIANNPLELLVGGHTLVTTPTTRLGWQVVSAADRSEVLVQQRTAVGLVAIATLLTASITGMLAAYSISRANRLVSRKVEKMQDELTYWQQKKILSKERSRLLTEIVEHMRRSLREEDILNTTVSELRYALNTDRVIVYRFLDDWTGIVVAESVALGWRKILGEKVEDPLREGLIERYRNGRVRAMNDIHTENLTDCHQDILEGFQIRGSIVAPVVQNDQLIGLLCAHQCAGPRHWEEEDVDLFSKLSSQLGYVLDQATLQQSQTISVDRSRLLTEIVNTMRRSQREDEILNNTVSELRYALNTERVIVYRFHDDWNGTIIAESVALGCRKILHETVQDPMREGYVERYRNGRVRVMNDVYTENLTQCHQDILEGFQIRASIVAPILQNGQLIGLLCAHHCSAPRTWHPEDVDLFGKLATQLGFALDQAAIMRKQIRSAEKSKLLSEIVGNMRRSMTREGVLNTIVSELRYALDTDRIIVYEFHDDWNGTIIAESVAAGCRKVLGEKVIDPMREGFIERYRNGRVRVMTDIYTENLTQCHQELLEGFQIRASVVAPILQNGQLIGLLCAHQCAAARQWELEEIDLFTQLAIQLGFALDQTALLASTENARKEARQEADAKTEEQRNQKEFLQRRAMELLKEVRPVSKGDLTVRARVTDDEVGTIAESYNTIIESLNEIVQQVQVSSQSVADTASKNEGAVTSLSQDAKLQMQAINGALKQIQAMVSSIQGVSDRSRKAEEIVLSATQTIQAGDEVMDQTVSGMSAIRETVSETAKKVKRLGEASQKVSRVVSLINGFAAQTNLLALNAAVEASRAGEEGQGFRVVAEEVRDLAQQSAQATDEIAHLVEEMQAQTNEVVAAMESGTDQVVTGTRLVEASRKQLSQISEVSTHINQLVREISQAAAAQTETSTAVSHTMGEIAAIADDTSKQSETVSHSFDHLLMVAKELQISVAQFKVN